MKKEKMSEEIMSAYELQEKRAESLFKKCHEDKKGMMDLEVLNPEKVNNLCKKHAELLQDFESVKEINRVISFRFDDVVKLLPTVDEIDLCVTRLAEIYEADEIKEAFKRLNSLRLVSKAVNQNNEKIRPKSYDESVESKEVEYNENSKINR